MYNSGTSVVTQGKGASRALKKAVRQKNWDAAADILSGCISQTPEDPQLRLLAGEMSARAARAEEAARHYLAGAEIYFKQGKLGRTAAVCKKVVALNPSLRAECDSLLSPGLRSASAKPTPRCENRPSKGGGSLWLPLHDIHPETKERFSEAIASLQEFPTITRRLCVKLHDPACKPSEVAGIAKADPVLVREVLRVVNSAYFGLRTEVSDVFRAILLLGYNYVYHMALQLTMKRWMPLALPEETLSHLWLHSLLVSSGAAYLAREMAAVSEGLATTVGLLHDLGKIVCHMVDPGQMAFLESEADGSVATELRLEEELFGADHAFFGALLAEHWDLPVTIQKAIAYHHAPMFVLPQEIPEEVLEVSALCCAGDLVARVFESPPGMRPSEDLQPEFYPILRQAPPVAALLNSSLVAELSKARSYFQSLRHDESVGDEGAAATPK